MADLFSDDSSFYGDEDAQRHFDSRNDVLDLHSYWEDHPRMINSIVYRAKAIKHMNMEEKPTLPDREPFNPMEGEEDARQLGETVSEFMQRAPVLSSSHLGPWLWVANPYAERDAIPETRDPKFLQKAYAQLQVLLTKKAKLAEENPSVAAGTITRKLKLEREQVKDDILDLAKQNGMTSGKWMLFPSEIDAAETWLTVAEAVVADKLGTAAKIATDGATRLICVYTKDFSDVEDITRVVNAMAELKLTSKEAARGIYYKCDAFTHLDISSGNEYGIAASLYASKDILNGVRPKQASRQATKQSTKPPAKQPTKQKRLSAEAFSTAKEPAAKKVKTEVNWSKGRRLVP